MILKHKIQSICNHVPHHAHTSITLGILLHVYVCFLANGFLFFLFKESFNENNCH